MIRREVKIPGGLLHPRRVLIANPDDLRIRVVVGHSKQVAHVKMIEIDANDFHSPMSGRLACRKPSQTSRCGEKIIRNMRNGTKQKTEQEDEQGRICLFSFFPFIPYYLFFCA